MGSPEMETHPVKRDGGLASIWLIPAGDILSATYDRQSESYVSVALRPGKRPFFCEFREDSARLRESVCFVEGVPLVSHEVSFSLAGIDEGVRRAVNRLTEGAGVVALVTTNCGESFLTGYSPDFGTEMALRLWEGVLSSGEKFADFPASHIVLRSKDTSVSLPFTGDMPG